MAKTPVSYSSRHFYQSFKNRFPNLKILPHEYYNILNTACLQIRNSLLEDGQFKMGNRIGDLMIRKFQPKGKGSSYSILDNKKSELQKKAVYQFNDHTGGFIYRFIWNKKRCKMISDKNMWIFKPIRSLKRKLAYMIITEKADYPIGIEVMMNKNEIGSTF